MMFARRLVAILLGGFLTLVVFAYANPAIDGGTMQGEMADHVLCPEMGMTPVCPGVLQHLAHWQSTFLVTLTEIFPLLLLLSIAAAVVWFLHRHLHKLDFSLEQQRRVRFATRSLLPRHILHEAFSRGIIHSKAY